MNMPLQRILQVEDDPDTAFLSKLVLEEAGGYDVQQCTNQMDAISATQNFDPQLLLLDFMLPGHSGLEIWDMLRGLPGYEDTPAIFLTARAEPELRSHLLAQGALAVLTKPFDAVRLADTIRAHWRTYKDSRRA